jgi:hypothetical protein
MAGARWQRHWQALCIHGSIRMPVARRHSSRALGIMSIMRIIASRGRLISLLSLLGFACWLCWWTAPQDPYKSRTEFGVQLMRFGDFEFGHNSYYLKDEDTGKTTSTGDAYRCGFVMFFVIKNYED